MILQTGFGQFREGSSNHLKVRMTNKQEIRKERPILLKL